MSASWTCEECGQHLRGHWAHCGLCCLTFSGTSAFDAHLKSLTNGGCHTEAKLFSLRTKQGAPKFHVLTIDGVEVWTTSALSSPQEHNLDVLSDRVGASGTQL